MPTKPDKNDLPPGQRKTLDFVTEYLEISGYAPTPAEIRDHLGVTSTFGVRKHVDALIRKGFLESRGAFARALVVVN